MSNTELADLLGLTDWRRDAMLKVQRDLFVPTVGLASPEEGSPYPIDREARPDEWMNAVYSDAAIITQRDDGKGDLLDIEAGSASSSISAPGIAFSFLELLQPRDHDRVLEIGTGTGYTAAVLAARLGSSNVTSIEVDPDVAAQAAVNLKAAGFSPHVVLGDGADGCPDQGPYDRVHATCAVSEIPHPWIEQTRPGGLIVAPWQPHRGGGLKVRLTVSGDSAYGRFFGPCGYMMLREQRAELVWQAHHHDEADVTSTLLDPRTVDQAGEGADLVVTARAPGIGAYRQVNDDGSFSLLLYEIGNSAGAWAACDYEPGTAQFEVTQYGDRRLWDEVADAYAWWVAAGEPGPERFGLTVGPAGENVWLDNPHAVVAASM
jgi:protein-L-isoaspartate(D-aspartate) O-methyltransferase